MTGSIIPVAPGRMRNIWYPGHKAAYVTSSQLKELGDVVIERDVMFGMEVEQEKEEEEQMVDVQMKLLPVRATPSLKITSTNDNTSLLVQRR